jgi:hypothetical protein
MWEIETDLHEWHSRQRSDTAPQSGVFRGFRGLEAEGKCDETHPATQLSTSQRWVCWLKKLVILHQVDKLQHYSKTQLTK